MKNQFPLRLRDFLTIQTEKFSPLWPFLEISCLRTNDSCTSIIGVMVSLLCDTSKIRTDENTFESKEYKKSPVINELFKSTPPDENNEIYSLFNIAHNRNDFSVSHAYVIEKGWNANENAYHYWIHQAFRDKFTLPKWEGTDDSWTSVLVLKNDPIIKRYDQFRGKQLALAEIEMFIEQEIKFTDTEEMEANMYVINNLKIQKLEALLEAQPKDDHKQEKDILSERTRNDTIILATSSKPKYDSLALHQSGFFSKLNFGVSTIKILNRTYITFSQVMRKRLGNSIF